MLVRISYVAVAEASLGVYVSCVAVALPYMQVLGSVYACSYMSGRVTLGVRACMLDAHAYWRSYAHRTG
jgi:hypothetical protein